jgi:hypothetical protein
VFYDPSKAFYDRSVMLLNGHKTLKTLDNGYKIKMTLKDALERLRTLKNDQKLF